ncbi:MAG: hypothetical protein ABR521_04415 [Gaiellaceae bacterium]
MTPPFRSGALLVLTLALYGCGGGGDGIEVRRVDGSRVELTGEPSVRCGPVGDADPERGEALYILGGGLARATGEAGWILFAEIREVRVDRPVAFPHARTDHPMLFVNVPPGIEASSSEEGSSGRLTFDRLTCEVGEEVSFSVDAVLGSERHGGEPIRIEGSFRGVVEAAPEEGAPPSP